MRARLASAAKLLLGLAVSLGLGWLAVRGLEWGRVGSSLSGVSPWLLALAIVVFIAGSYLRAYRWKILFMDENISTPRLFVIQNEGIGLNNLVPVRVASEALQLAILTMRDRVNGATALATLGMERVVDVVASAGILGVAFFLVPEMREFKLYVLGAMGFAVAAVAAVRLLSWGGQSLSIVRRFRRLAAFADAVHDLEQEPLRLAASLLVSIGFWLTVGATTWLISRALGIPVSPVTATVVILGTIFFATAVPALPGAVGTFEAAIVYILGFFDYDRSAGFALAVLVHAVLFIPPTVIAVVMLPREGIIPFGRFGRLIPWASDHGIGASV